MKFVQNITIGDDLTRKLSLKGVGESHLRGISEQICYQICIYEEDLEGIEWFKFEKGYKYGILLHIWTLFFLRIHCDILCLSVS